METNTDAIFLKKPFLEDVYDLVLPEKSKWKEIGNELWVIGCRPLPRLNYLGVGDPYSHKRVSEHLRNFKKGSDDEENLEDMFSNWIEGKYSEVSWKHLIEVLRKLKLLDVVVKIEEFLKSETTVKKYEVKNIFTMPTMKTVYEILHHNRKKDYSAILSRYGYHLMRTPSTRSPIAEYDKSELELTVILVFLNSNNDTVEWKDLVEELDSLCRYNIIGKIIAYLECKGSSTDEILKTFMKVDYKVVLLNDAMEVLSTRWSKQEDWYSIGQKLGVDREYRQKLNQDGDLSDEKKLEAVLEKWLKSISSPDYYWGDFRSVIRDDLKYHDVANSINEVLTPPKEENYNGEDTVAQETTVKPIESNVDSYVEQLYEVMSNGAQGIIFILGMNGPAGTEVDVKNVKETFQELNFATYIVRDRTAENVTTLIKAAATIDYPLTYQYVALYFAGHGGMNDKEQKFIVCSGQKKVYIKDAIIHPLKCLREKSQTRLFFFDCCLSTTASYCSLSPIKKSVKPYPGEITAYATNVGEKSLGDEEKGGIWTDHLCKNLRELDEPITTILSKTFEDVVKVRGNFQEPLVEGIIGIRKLKQDSLSTPIGRSITYSASINNQSRSALGLLMATRSRETLDNVDSNSNYYQVKFSPETVVRLLRHDSKWWSDFALELDIDGEDRDSLIKNETLTDEEKLQRVIEIWFKEKTCSVSWKKIISVARELNLTDTAARLEKASKIKVQTEEWRVMYRILRFRADKYWEDVAVCLEIDDELIDEMKTSLNKTGNERFNLERVIRQWIDKETCEVSWMKIISVAWELGFNEESNKLMEEYRITLNKPTNV